LENPPGSQTLSDPFAQVLNVIVADGSGETLAPLIRAAVAAHGAADEIAWLSPNHAFDVAILGDAASVKRAAASVPGAAEADINVVPAEGRRKKLLIADMDSTIIACECLDELADMAGLKPLIAAITERAMKGEIAFAPALRERVALLKGLPLAALERTYKERVRLNPGAKTLVATMKKHGAHTLLVSGGFTYFTERVAAAAGFEEHQANVLLDDGAALTGAVQEPILGREAKRAALDTEIVRLGLEIGETLCVGDGANDLDMIRGAGLGVAWHAKPILAEAAAASIAHNDLTALLYLQGYHDEDIVRLSD
jgi:phosphoserine phosphatase